MFFLGNVWFPEFLAMTGFCFLVCFCRFGGKVATNICPHHWTLRPVTSPSFHPTTLHSHLRVPPDHNLPRQTRTLPPVTQVLRPDITPTHHISILGRHQYVRTFQDHFESTIFNLNCGGEGQRGTCTDLKHMEDRQACARVTGGKGSDIICPCQCGGEETSASTYS